ncbi:hypothetical protein GH721_08970 [Kriegella sp. EG-1]|nr:hypothetical protein [Flavobacteriaceae bacterium EG-1]
MAYKALLTIDDLDTDYDGIHVHYCEFEFSRRIDIKTGHVLSNVQAGLIHITIDSTKNASLLDWLLRGEQKDGTIIFKTDSADGSMVTSKKLIFAYGKCVDYREVFESSTGNAMRCHFSIWCEEIRVGDSVPYKVIWNDE